jgi:squalene-hopene/tetraprenyl-beta-curcumene cyclase
MRQRAIHAAPLATVVTLGFVLSAAIRENRVRGDDAGPSWNAKAAAEYLDARGDWWLRWSGAGRGQGTACLSCHTSLPYALARPALGAALGETAPGAVEQKVLDNVKRRVENWETIVARSAPDKDPFRAYYAGGRHASSLGTEAVLNALVLANADARRAGDGPSAATRKALGHVWEQQQESGAWQWLEFGLNPWEKDGAYYGACLAAVAVGTAGRDYSDGAEVRPNVAALKKYLTTQFLTQPLHHRALALWASSRLPGILTDADCKALVEELLAVQESDGGWALPRLGKPASGGDTWKSHGVYPDGAVGDGYATGLVVLALKRAGVAADHPQVRKGVAWLAARQADGTWPISYPNKARDPQSDVGKFMRDAAAAFAVLALTEPAVAGRGPGNATEPGKK